MASISDLYVIASGLDHPEGVATGPDGTLWAGGEAGQVYRIDSEAGTATEIANTGGFVLGIAHDAAGRLYLCDAGRRAILRVDPRSGDVGVWCDSAGGAPLETPNYPAFAADGSLYFSDSGTESLDVRNGRMIRVPPGGGDGEVLDLGTLHFTNGVCVTGDGAVHFLETLTPRLSTIVDGRAEVIAELPGNDARRPRRVRRRRVHRVALLPVPPAARPAGRGIAGGRPRRPHRDPHADADQRRVLRRGPRAALPSRRSAGRR